MIFLGANSLLFPTIIAKELDLNKITLKTQHLLQALLDPKNKIHRTLKRESIPEKDGEGNPYVENHLPGSYRTKYAKKIYHRDTLKEVTSFFMVQISKQNNLRKHIEKSERKFNQYMREGKYAEAFNIHWLGVKGYAHRKRPGKFEKCTLVGPDKYSCEKKAAGWEGKDTFSGQEIRDFLEKKWKRTRKDIKFNKNYRARKFKERLSEWGITSSSLKKLGQKRLKNYAKSLKEKMTEKFKRLKTQNESNIKDRYCNKDCT